MSIKLLPEYIIENYEIHEWKHSCAILKNDFPSEFLDITGLLIQFKLKKSAILEAGGGKSPISKDIDSFLYNRALHVTELKCYLILISLNEEVSHIFRKHNLLFPHLFCKTMNQLNSKYLM